MIFDGNVLLTDLQLEPKDVRNFASTSHYFRSAGSDSLYRSVSLAIFPKQSFPWPRPPLPNEQFTADMCHSLTAEEKARHIHTLSFEVRQLKMGTFRWCHHISRESMGQIRTLLPLTKRVRWLRIDAMHGEQLRPLLDHLPALETLEVPYYTWIDRLQGLPIKRLILWGLHYPTSEPQGCRLEGLPNLLDLCLKFHPFFDQDANFLDLGKLNLRTLEIEGTKELDASILCGRSSTLTKYVSRGNILLSNADLWFDSLGSQLRHLALYLVIGHPCQIVFPCVEILEMHYCDTDLFTHSEFPALRYFSYTCPSTSYSRVPYGDGCLAYRPELPWRILDQRKFDFEMVLLRYHDWLDGPFVSDGLVDWLEDAYEHGSLSTVLLDGFTHTARWDASDLPSDFAIIEDGPDRRQRWQSRKEMLLLVDPSQRFDETTVIQQHQTDEYGLFDFCNDNGHIPHPIQSIVTI
ncbi:MAG: hypothetical protein ACRYGR_00545 [Janthinobacterium lividum]